jgi:hypothetical protein
VHSTRSNRLEIRSEREAKRTMNAEQFIHNLMVRSEQWAAQFADRLLKLTKSEHNTPYKIDATISANQGEGVKFFPRESIEDPVPKKIDLDNATLVFSESPSSYPVTEDIRQSKAYKKLSKRQMGKQKRISSNSVKPPKKKPEPTPSESGDP